MARSLALPGNASVPVSRAVVRCGTSPSTNGTLTVKNSTFTGVQYYVATDGGSPPEGDAALNNTFDGVTVSGSTSLAQIYAIEDKITDALDDSTNGLVRLVAGNVYVTAAKGDIFINSGFGWTGSSTLTINAYRNVTINAPLTLSNGTLSLTAGSGPRVRRRAAAAKRDDALRNGVRVAQVMTGPRERMRPLGGCQTRIWSSAKSNPASARASRALRL